jgi:hypothetical protein
MLDPPVAASRNHEIACAISSVNISAAAQFHSASRARKLEHRKLEGRHKVVTRDSACRRRMGAIHSLADVVGGILEFQETVAAARHGCVPGKILKRFGHTFMADFVAAMSWAKARLASTDALEVDCTFGEKCLEGLIAQLAEFGYTE